MSHSWKKVQDELVDEKNIYKKSINIILVPSQRYQDFRHILLNPKVSRNVVGFSNCADGMARIKPVNKSSPQRFRRVSVMTAHAGRQSDRHAFVVPLVLLT